MYYFVFLLVLLAGISGFYVGVVGFREYTNITRTAEKISILQIIKIAGQLGIASSLVFFATISSASFFDPEYVWSLQKLRGAIFASLILGVIVTLGGVYQIYTTVIFRDALIRKYRQKDKSENHNGS
jgi:hypothetical protein